MNKKSWSRTTAVGAMVLCGLLWSSAGVVTRQLHDISSFEASFWRSLFTVLTLWLAMPWMRGRSWYQSVPWKNPAVWISSVCWAMMFTLFMVAMVLTSVANVLITLALGPLLTAFISQYVTAHPLPRRTWWAIALAGFGISYMFWSQFQLGSSRDMAGCLLALGVPICAAINWTNSQYQQAQGKTIDLVPCVLLGGALSAMSMLPLSWPFQAQISDVAWLAFLGIFQLALPCVLAVLAANVLKAAEVALLALLEVIFGITWAWLFASEQPSLQILLGGLLVMGALIGNSVLEVVRTTKAGTPRLK